MPQNPHAHIKIVVGEERRVPVNGSPHGTISWNEHQLAWLTYHYHHPQQTAETIAARGGFGIEELILQLGRVPTSWLPDERTNRRYFPKEVI